MSNPLMKCGHTANATNGDNKPVCAICIGIRPGADEVDPNPPSLEGRLARCGYCGNNRSSEYGLAFFEHFPKAEYDSYYCGCRGWD